MGVFQHGLTNPLRDATMNLALNNHRINQIAEIITATQSTMSTTPVAGSTSTSAICVPDG